MTTEVFRVAIILTHNRPELLDQTFWSAVSQGAYVIIIDNASEPPVPDVFSAPNTLIRVPTQPPNLSRFWNIGLGISVVQGQIWGVQEWDVAYLCDDVQLPSGWWDVVSSCMRTHDAVAASTHCAVPVEAPILKTAPDNDIWNRMCPWAFMMRGEYALLADEDLKWWWGDTHMDFTARVRGGMVIAPGPVVVNERVNEFTNTVPGLGEQAGRDGEVFAAKWGGRPW